MENNVSPNMENNVPSISVSPNIENNIPPNIENNIPSKTNIMLANAISVFHGFIVLFVLLTPLTDIPCFLILHITFCISLIVHWYGNSNMCSLSVIESNLRGLPYTESYSHKFISGIYDISKTSWSKICYIITIILLCISIYKLYNSNKFELAYNKFKEISKDISNKDLSIVYKLKLYLDNIPILFCF